MRAPRRGPGTRARDEFRQQCAEHDVGLHIGGIKDFRHREVGEVRLDHERLEAFDTALTIFAYTADFVTPSAEALTMKLHANARLQPDRSSRDGGDGDRAGPVDLGGPGRGWGGLADKREAAAPACG